MERSFRHKHVLAVGKRNYTELGYPQKGLCTFSLDRNRAWTSRTEHK